MFVTANVLQRTFQIQSGNATATCFTIDVDGRQYVVTARHVLSADPKNAAIRLQQGGTWRDLTCRHVGDAPGEIDISVLAPSSAISPSHPLSASTTNLALGQDVCFLGFPFGFRAEVGALNAHFPLPLVKKGCISLLELFKDRNRYFLLDGHNNPGFSGGPVVVVPPGEQGTTQVIAVVSGYRCTIDPVFEGSNETPLSVRYNTGLVIAYAIDYAVDLIKANPIGAVVPP